MQGNIAAGHTAGWGKEDGRRRFVSAAKLVALKGHGFSRAVNAAKELC